MKRLNSDQFYKILNSEYRNIKRYTKDVIYDYNNLFNLEKDDVIIKDHIFYKENVYKKSNFNIAIFIRQTGTHFINFNPCAKLHTGMTYSEELYQNLKQNNDICLLCQKCTDSRTDQEFYFITKVNLRK
jgi:hypothetical protein